METTANGLWDWLLQACVTLPFVNAGEGWPSRWWYCREALPQTSSRHRCRNSVCVRAFVCLFCVCVCACVRCVFSPSVIKKEYFMKIFSFPPPRLPGFDQFFFLYVGGSCICLNNCVSLLLCTAEDLVTQ